MRDLLRDAGIPHINQTAYQRRVSCADTIFTTQEAIARCVREGSGVHMCLYAFDLSAWYFSTGCSRWGLMERHGGC